MKLLFDENLSPRLVQLLASEYPGSAHVHAVGLGEASDIEVWEYAPAHGYIIASKDSDFVELSVVRGAPPKIVWIRRGNCSTREIMELLRAHRESVDVLALHEAGRYLAID